MIELLIGLVCGLVEFFLLQKLIASFITGKIKSALLIFAVKLLLMVFVLYLAVVSFKDGAVLTGGGMAASLIFSAVLNFIIKSPKRKECDTDAR